MGAGASAASPTLLSAESLPKQLFVEGAGCVRANGKFVLRTGKHGFPTLRTTKLHLPAVFNRGAWFAKDGDEGCWMGLLDEQKAPGLQPIANQWIIFTSEAILYIAPKENEKLSPPLQGQWDGGFAVLPAPTVNLQPLPTAFRLSGWTGHNACLNGEYLPLADGTKLFDGHAIFKHVPVVGAWAGQDKHRLFWSHGAWRIGNKDQMEPGQKQCMAFVESDTVDTNHPSDIPVSSMVWKGTAYGRDFGNSNNDFLRWGTLHARGWHDQNKSCPKISQNEYIFLINAICFCWFSNMVCLSAHAHLERLPLVPSPCDT